jgi:hypothetical protein
MLIRAIALSLALIIGVGTIIPIATEYAEAGPKKSKRDIDATTASNTFCISCAVSFCSASIS